VHHAAHGPGLADVRSGPGVDAFNAQLVVFFEKSARVLVLRQLLAKSWYSGR